jgi:anti-sigma factor RsiW
VSCQPELVTGFVDGALSAEEAAAVEAHLAECPACREQAEAERDLGAKLRELPPPEPRPGFEGHVRRQLEQARPRSRRWLLGVAAAAVLAILWLRGSVPFVAWQLAGDHGHCFAQTRLPAKVWGDDPDDVIRWFEAQGTRMPPLPRNVGEIELVGGRYCPLVDRRVAHVYYASRNGRPVSVFVVTGPARFDHEWAGQSRSRQVRLFRSASSTVAVVTDESREADAFQAAFTTTVAALGPR